MAVWTSHVAGSRGVSSTAQMGESAGTEGAIQITGTPTSGGDNASVMNGGTALNTWAGFSSYDLTATRALYPLPAPSLTVSNVGGVPQVSWSALVGATSYDVLFTINTRDTDEFRNIYVYDDDYPLGNTTGTSWLDTDRTYTGTSSCFYSGAWGTTRETYRYRVTANFPNGTRVTSILAPVAQC